MYSLILQLGIFLSLGGIIYIISRTLPRISEIETQPQKPLFLKKWLSQLPLEKFDSFFSELFEKFLRRARVVVLKADNWVNIKIARMKERGGVKEGSEVRQNIFKSEEKTES